MQNITAFFCLTVALSARLALAQTSDDVLIFAEKNEQLRWRHEENGVRVLILSSNLSNPTLSHPTLSHPTHRKLVIYATPNGNSLEKSLGCTLREGLDWRYDIQHIAAQWRALRELDSNSDYVLAIVEAPQLSWPEFRKATQNANLWIRGLVESLEVQTKSDETILSCHSGGGSFLWGWINAHDELPKRVSKIVFLDANYSYSDDDHHGEKLLQWLNDAETHRLEVIAYDDRAITLNGKKVVGDDGGTYRATHRMIDRLQIDLDLAHRIEKGFRITESSTRNVQFIVHANPSNEILHTKLVGEMNGFLFAMCAGSQLEHASQFGGPRAYSSHVQSTPFVDPRVANAKLASEVPARELKLPKRLPNAEPGSEFIARVANCDRTQREQEILQAIRLGNVPTYSRLQVGVEVTMVDSENQKHTAVYFVCSDYIAIGSDIDSVRIPVTPATAIAISDMLGCTLITPKVSDDLFAAAQVRLAPHPLTVDRESPVTFLQHHQWIESQKGESKLNEKDHNPLIVGIKKDIVWSQKLAEKPHKVAIYGWHYQDGRPIQRVYCGHVDWYVDYSHGLRLLYRQMSVDGQDMDIGAVLKDPVLHRLVSIEGMLDIEELRRRSQWKI